VLEQHDYLEALPMVQAKILELMVRWALDALMAVLLAAEFDVDAGTDDSLVKEEEDAVECHDCWVAAPSVLSVQLQPWI